ncbi:hypothetical protein Snoj_15550 [Streptomyces nojiriensis]|uniref:Uncharacterized protein n=1 Tax=Streptomyces nojiriensis TaxID=66374 RepID=A0ABQ3SI73_9ACTN|nr:hypothetical protein GCM10010205_44470 [Streptomyces nojiriensis]GHI67637.1 hypothetical protein Snoj_15550 [Streptomyces nojiriensis]
MRRVPSATKAGETTRTPFRASPETIASVETLIRSPRVTGSSAPLGMGRGGSAAGAAKAPPDIPDSTSASEAARPIFIQFTPI